MNETELALLKRLLYLRSYIDFDFLLEKRSVDLVAVSKYYKIANPFFYRLFCSWRGFMHIGLSNNGVYRREYGYENSQLINIAQYIDNNENLKIVELGCGQCAGLKYLAQQRPAVSFIGVDLVPSPLGKIAQNMVTIQADYHRLDFLVDSSVDGFYAIETLCYSDKKEMLFRQLYEKLKPGGFVAIYDGYTCKGAKSYSQIETLCLEILSRAYHVPEFEYINDVESAIRIAGFSIDYSLNLKGQAMPFFNEIGSRVEKYCRLGPLLRLALKIMPQDLKGSMIPGYLLCELMQANLVSYQFHLLKKKEENNAL